MRVAGFCRLCFFGGSLDRPGLHELEPGGVASVLLLPAVHNRKNASLLCETVRPSS